jgi:DnaJ-domain-containing protein 1
VSVTEILVVIGGLALGYWVVTRLIADLNRDEKRPPGKGSVSEMSGAVVDSGLPWHEVLKVPPDAALEDIRRSYEVLMQQYQPDKVAAPDEELKAVAERKFREIDAAYRQAMRARGANSEPR